MCVSAALGSHLNLCFIAVALWCCFLANVPVHCYEGKMGQNREMSYRITTKIYSIGFGPWATPQLSKNFHQNQFAPFRDILFIKQ